MKTVIKSSIYYSLLIIALLAISCGEQKSEDKIKDLIANREFKRAAELIQTTPEADLKVDEVMQVAVFFSEKTAYQISVPLFEMVLRLNPGDPFANLLLANNLRQEKEYNRSMKLYDKIVDIDSIRYIVLPERARLFIHLTDYDKARKDIMEAKNLQPKYFASYLADGLLEYSQGNQQEAIDLFDIAEELDPGVSGEASLYSGYIMVNNNINYDALTKFTRAIEVGKNVNKGYAFINRGVCQINLQDTMYACQDWDSAAHYMPEEAAKYLKDYCEGVRRPNVGDKPRREAIDMSDI